MSSVFIQMQEGEVDCLCSDVCLCGRSVRDVVVISNISSLFLTSVWNKRGFSCECFSNGPCVVLLLALWYAIFIG